MMNSFVKTPESVGTEAVPGQEMGVEEDGGGVTGVSQGLKRQREPHSSEEENVLTSQESIGDLKRRCRDPSGEESRDPELQEAESPVIHSLSGAEGEVLDTPTTSTVQSRRGGGVKSAGGAVSSGAPPVAQRCLSDPGLVRSDLHEEEDKAKPELHLLGNAEFRSRLEQFESRQDGPSSYLSSPRPRVLSSFVRAVQQKLRSAETPSTSRAESIRQEREQELRLLRSQSISENPWLKRSFSDSFLAELEPPVPAKVPRNAREQTALQDHGSATGPVPSEEVQCSTLETSPELNDVGKVDKFQQEAQSPAGREQEGAESLGQHQEEAGSPTGQKQSEAESRTSQKQEEVESCTGQKQSEVESCTGQEKEEAESSAGEKREEAESRTGQEKEEAESSAGEKQEEAESHTGQKQEEAESSAGEKREEAESRTGQEKEEAESSAGEKREEAESRTGQEKEEAESSAGEKREEAESRTGQEKEEAESSAGEKQEEAESHTGQKQEEAESRTGQEKEEAESSAGEKQEEAESHTGQKQEEAESHTGQKQEEAESPGGQKQAEPESSTGQKVEEAESCSGQKQEEAGSPGGQQQEEAASATKQNEEVVESPSIMPQEEVEAPVGQPQVEEGSSNGKHEEEETSASKPKKAVARLSNGSQEELPSSLGEGEGLSNGFSDIGGSRDKRKTEPPSEELGVTGSAGGSTCRTREERAVDLGDLKNVTFDPVQDVIGGLESVTDELKRSAPGSELGSLEEELNTSEMIDRMFRGVLDMADEEEEGGSSEAELEDDGTGEGQEEDDGHTPLDSSLEELSTIPPSFALSPLGRSMEMVITSLRLSSNCLPDSLPLTPEEPSPPLVVGGSLPYSIDTYRTRRPVSQHAIKSSIAGLCRPEPERSRPRPSVNNKERIAGLREEAARLQDIITQTLQALSCCAERSPRIGSLAEAEAERLLLVSCEKRAALLAEVSRLRGGVSGNRESESAVRCPEPCRGTVSIRNLQLPLKVEFLCSSHARTGQPMHYFFVLVRYGACNIVATPLASTTDAQNGDALCFPTSITLQDIRSSFQIDVEVYSLSSAVRSSSMEQRASKPKVTPKRLLNSITRIKRKTRSFTLPTVDPHRSSNFCLVGSHKITLGSLGQCKFPLDKVPFLSPLEGNIYLQLQCEGHSKVQRSGFLTMFEDVHGFAMWQRRWFCLQGDSLSYWSYPSYQHCKPAEGVISLSCSNILSARPVRRNLCTRSHTIELVSGGIEPQESLRTRDKRWFSADTFEERTEWLDKLNQTLLDLHTWSLTPATFDPQPSGAPRESIL